MKLSEILSVATDGRAQVTVVGYPVTIILPSHVRDHHPMGRFQQWLVGSRTPGMTWRDGIAISEPLLRKLYPRQVLELLVHENAHWWQLWRRMGPTDFPATYGYQAVLARVRYGSMHVHQMHPVEREARAIANAVLAVTDQMLRVRQPCTFDLLPWLEQHYPPRRP